MDYVTVYDVSHSWYRHWWFPAAGLIFLAVGLLMHRFRGDRSRGLSFGITFSIFAACWTVLALGIVASNYFGLVSELRNGRCEIVEGVVTEFVPWSDAIKKDETFVVNGHRFHYSDFTVTPGFNHTQPYGGPIHEGLRVRIHCSGNDIAKLEIARMRD